MTTTNIPAPAPATTREAEQIVREWADAYQVDCAGPGTLARLATEIDKALQARDERAAKVAWKLRQNKHSVGDDFEVGFDAACDEIAKEIRKG